MLVFKGLEKTSLMDYPGFVSVIVFTSGCDMRCPYCHNPKLINNKVMLPDIKEREVIKFLKSRKEWVDAIVITGGEPTIHHDLPAFIKKVKRLGFKVKLDTNGLNPGMINELINNKLVDYFALDIKASEKNYDKACGVKVSFNKIKKSVKLIMASGIDYEFRTTMVPGIHSKTDLLRIAKWLKGARKFVIQQFRSEFPTLDPAYKDKKTFSYEELKSFKEAVTNYFKEVIVRGK